LDEPRAPTCMQPRIDMIELRSGNSDVQFGLFELLDYSGTALIHHVVHFPDCVFKLKRGEECHN
jgi:hypothetical protein